MAKEKIDIRAEIKQYEHAVGLRQKVNCTKEENKEFRQLLKTGQALPEGVIKYNDFDDFYRIHVPDLTEEEVNKYLTFKQLDLLTTIKGYLTFFVAITVISLLIGLIFGLQAC